MLLVLLCCSIQVVHKKLKYWRATIKLASSSSQTLYNHLELVMEQNN